MGAILQLERFDRGGRSASPMFRQAQLDAAFADGVAEGLRQAEAMRSDQLGAVLTELSANLESGRAMHAQSQVAQMLAMAPLLDAMLEQLTPVVARARLRDAVLAQMADIAGAVSPLGVKIRCDAGTGEFLSAHLARLGLSAVQIDASGPEGIVEAEMTGGEITWDEAAISTQLRRLIEEMMETD
ncbi:hypothetical protein SAMN04488075_1995 [Paracoccus alkenifer]|uniref:Flagellar assembly protein FliH n=2 Tax=Paracoccus alkenifer TaxID=65735 RepID=A0A1H6M7E0_9RHOB|nr:hypothetical protein SAMN04488075_1995 [Paracoccus alkenifer]